MARILQLNVNHSGPSQDNLIHLRDEMNANLAVIAEPHRITHGNSKWTNSIEEPPLAAILWKKCRGLFLPMQKLECGAGFSLVRWNNLVIASCYNSCNCTIREYNAFLDALHLALVSWSCKRANVGTRRLQCAPLKVEPRENRRA